MHRTLTSFGAVVLAATSLVACRRAERTADTAAVAESAATTTPPAAAPAPAEPALTDANVVFILDAANAADSARGALAQTKGTSADVKSFGKLMVGEHHALRAAGQALATKLNVSPAAPSGDQSEAQAKQELDSLNVLAKGAAWDKAYIDYEVVYHRSVLETATKALDAAQNAELKALIQKAAPVIQHHLDRAQEIQKKLGGTA
jgi:putative membrane protein